MLRIHFDIFMNEIEYRDKSFFRRKKNRRSRLSYVHEIMSKSLLNRFIVTKCYKTLSNRLFLYQFDIVNAFFEVFS